MRTNIIKQKIQEYFLLNPTAKLRVRQIEREIHVPLPSAIRYAKELEEEGVLQSLVISGVRFYTANRTSKTYLLEKKLFNLRSLYSSGLVEHFIETHSNPTLILFGSYSRGEDIETSDIDLMLITEKTTKDPKIEEFEAKLLRKVQIFSVKRVEDLKNNHLINNVLNGIVLNGFAEVFHERSKLARMLRKQRRRNKPRHGKSKVLNRNRTSQNSIPKRKQTI